MKHFTLEEFVKSATAARLGIDNTPSAEAVAALNALVDNVLDPLREAWRQPIFVTSGYRCDRLNTAVGGARRSRHRRGMAADITAVDRADNPRLFALVTNLNLPFTQLIDEKNMAWIHVAYDPADIRRQILKL